MLSLYNWETDGLLGYSLIQNKQTEQSVNIFFLLSDRRLLSYVPHKMPMNSYNCSFEKHHMLQKYRTGNIKLQ